MEPHNTVGTIRFYREIIKHTCSNPYLVEGNSTGASEGEVLQFYGLVQLKQH